MDSSSTLNNNNCSICEKKFSRASAKNRHIKEVHKADLPSTSNNKKTNIICSICNDVVITHEKLKKHLFEVHDLSCEEERLAFINKQSFEDWRALDNRNLNYIFEYSKANRDYMTVRYICNRSNLRGFKSNCIKRTVKAGGSIKISGTCPSRITANIFPDETVNVQYVKTHVGHTNELRTQRLYKNTIIFKAHNEAEKPGNIVQLVEIGKFKVKSARCKQFYTVLTNDNKCDSDCRTMYCRICKICKHKYSCECVQDMKSTLCKHIHMVAQYERELSEWNILNHNRTEVKEESKQDIHIVETANTEIVLKQEVPAFLNESLDDDRRKIKMEEIINSLNSLDNQTFDKTADEVLSVIVVNREGWNENFIKLEN